MNADDTYSVEPLSENAALPWPFVGGYERITNNRTGDCETALYVFALVKNGNRAYVGTFFGSFAHQANDAFRDWLQIHRDKGQMM